MIIQNRIVYVYDIEVFPNVFHCTVKNTETNELHKFEISARKIDLQNIKIFYEDSNKMFCGYNNHHYDDPVINYILDNYNIMITKNIWDITRSIFNLSRIITTEENTDKWKKWKYMHCFNSFDILTMLYSNKLRVSLKEMQVTMHYDNVQEFTADWQQDLPIEQIDSMIEYNINDVNSTT